MVKINQSLEKLFELVRQNTSLYNAEDPNYKDAIMTANIWSSIAKSMGEQNMDGKLCYNLQ